LKIHCTPCKCAGVPSALGWLELMALQRLHKDISRLKSNVPLHVWKIGLLRCRTVTVEQSPSRTATTRQPDLPRTIPSGAKDAFVLLMSAAPCHFVLWCRVSMYLLTYLLKSSELNKYAFLTQLRRLLQMHTVLHRTILQSQKQKLIFYSMQSERCCNQPLYQ